MRYAFVSGLSGPVQGSLKSDRASVAPSSEKAAITNNESLEDPGCPLTD
jgi:hypothetical protein